MRKQPPQDKYTINIGCCGLILTRYITQVSSDSPLVIVSVTVILHHNRNGAQRYGYIIYDHIYTSQRLELGPLLREGEGGMC